MASLKSVDELLERAASAARRAMIAGTIKERERFMEQAHDHVQAAFVDLYTWKAEHPSIK